MYSIDINLLRERTETQTGRPTEFTSGTAIAPSKYSKVPLFIGIGAAALTILSAGGGWFWLGQQTTQLEAKQKELDVKLGSLQAQDLRLADLNGQVAKVSDETQSFASVFNQIQPWSAVLQDLRESIPQGVQINTVAQSEVKSTSPVASAAAPVAPKGGLAAKISTVPNPEAKLTPTATAPAAAPTAGQTAGGVTTYPTLEDSIAAKFPGGNKAEAPIVPATPLAADVPTTKLDITGTAKSFDEVNNFILTLKQSAFFNPDETQLLSAGLMPVVTLTRPTTKAVSATPTAPTPPTKPNRLELPPVVEYKIQTSLKRIPAADLIRELERKGAVGLVARLKSLQQQQVIKP